MKSPHNLTTHPQRPGLLLKCLPFATAGLFLGLASPASANTCNYGENFDFTDTVANKVSMQGSLPALDIDRQAVTVTVTKTGGGNLPPGVLGGSLTAGTSFEANSPAFTPVDGSSTATSYGHALYLTQSADVPGAVAPLTFTFSKSMRNLVMHFAYGDNKLFSFTDGAGNPLEFTIRSSDTLADPPTSGNGSSVAFFKQMSANSLAVGEIGFGTIAFKNPVTVIRMTQTYIGTSINPGANLNTGVNNSTNGAALSVNFGQYCDQPGVLDYCNNMNFARWDTVNYSASTNPDTASGKIIDDTGKAITVGYSGALSQAALVTMATYNNSVTNGAASSPGANQAPFRPLATVLVNSDTVPVGTIITQTWTFGEEVANPGLWLRGTNSSAATIKFYKDAAATIPLPFLLRNPNEPGHNRQVDSNELYAPAETGSLIQFTGSTSLIVAKITKLVSVSGSYNNNSTVFLGCKGLATASGSGISTDTDGDGVPDLSDKCPNTPAGAVVGSDGCPLPTDLSIVKTASVTAITPGVAFDYVITVTNTGAQATNVKASDIVPAGLTINSSSASNGGVITTNGQTVQALWSIVPAGETRTLTINVTKP